MSRCTPPSPHIHRHRVPELSVSRCAGIGGIADGASPREEARHPPCAVMSAAPARARPARRGSRSPSGRRRARRADRHGRRQRRDEAPSPAAASATPPPRSAPAPPPRGRGRVSAARCPARTAGRPGRLDRRDQRGAGGDQLVVQRLRRQVGADDEQVEQRRPWRAAARGSARERSDPRSGALR